MPCYRRCCTIDKLQTSIHTFKSIIYIHIILWVFQQLLLQLVQIMKMDLLVLTYQPFIWICFLFKVNILKRICYNDNTVHHLTLRSLTSQFHWEKKFKKLVTKFSASAQDARNLAERLLGKTVYAEWPHLKEVKVVAVSDGQYRWESADSFLFLSRTYMCMCTTW